MEKELTCIVCPNGCSLKITGEEGNYKVTGNICKRGEEFAINEMTCPKRTISSTVKTIFPDVPVVSVRVSSEIPKDKIFMVMDEINKVVLKEKVGIGFKVIENVLSLGVDVIVTSNILLDK